MKFQKLILKIQTFWRIQKMNKEQLTQILQSCLFAFDGLDKEEIIKLNPDYDLQLVQIGIKLFKFLKQKIE